MLSKILLVEYTAFQTTYLQEKSWITLNIIQESEKCSYHKQFK